MFGTMRRKDRELPADTAMEILQNAKFGVLSVSCENGYPYGVPMHYVLIDGKIYFHSTNQGGTKQDAMKKISKVSFTVIEPLEGVRCQSTILFGTVQAVPHKKAAVLEKIVEKFVPPLAWDGAKGGIPGVLNNMEAYELTIDHISAKVIDKPEGRG